ncbi:S9 family peptidase [Pseudofulvibacter geojedonensis]|uniref:S9 family peptidase n=1 Tax=Pseudofulvibacter geojedonensis TaxID=1123758 RepID=A0ABW3I2P7_9FLAO
MIKKLSILVLTLIFAVACKKEKSMETVKTIQPPLADKKAKTLEKHGDIRVDNYFWLNEKENEEVIDYLERENDYYHKKMAHTEDFQKSLFEEMKERIKEDDSSVPYKYNGYWYITKFEKGKDYPIYIRKKDSLTAKEEVLFNCNEMAEGHSYFSLKGINVSPDNKLAAFAVDTVSRRQYTLQIKNLETNEILPTSINNTTGGSTWANDNMTLFYTRKDPVTLRSDRVYKHFLGENAVNDKEVFHEKDETFNTFVFKSKSKKYIIIGSNSTLTNEYRILDANTPEEDFKVFQKRERGLEYDIAHYGDKFYIITNKDGATNFKLMTTPESKTSQDNWTDLIPHRESVLLEDIEIFKDYLVISERENGLSKIKISRWDQKESYYLPFDNETYTAYTSTNLDFDTNILRYGYNSLTTPASTIDFNMETKEKTIKKEQEVLGGKFNKDNYTSERVWATARDGKKVPISLVYRKDTQLNKNTPLLQYAYGSYGSTIDPYFSTVRLSLLDRGFVYAIAHIRGSQYLGRPWYEDGKLLQKKNTFTDFIDCSKFLIEKNYTSADHLYAMGGSAGGLLMGAIMNMSPETYNGVVAAVPFVDVVTTMLDDSIPLTTGEYDEWGNPNIKEYYDYMKSYSPYDNVVAQSYPNTLITTGFHDSQVQYFEPAKWTAKLRELKTDDNLLLFRCDMDSGHGGASGRFEALKEVAEEYAFILDLEGISK